MALGGEHAVFFVRCELPCETKVPFQQTHDSHKKAHVTTVGSTLGAQSFIVIVCVFTLINMVQAAAASAPRVAQAKLREENIKPGTVS